MQTIEGNTIQLPKTNRTILDSFVNGIFGTVETAPLTEEQIREKAYHLWEEAGRPESDGVEFWLRAEQELNA